MARGQVTWAWWLFSSLGRLLLLLCSESARLLPTLTLGHCFSLGFLETHSPSPSGPCSSCSVHLVVTPALLSSSPRRSRATLPVTLDFVGKNSGFCVLHSPRLQLMMLAPWELALDAWCCEGGAQASPCPLPPAGLQAQKSKGNRHRVAPEPSRPSHSGDGSGGNRPGC